METEEYFPRGQLKTVERNPFANEIDFIFNTKKRKTDFDKTRTVKKPRLSKSESVSEINYRNVQEGMAMLACIRSITTFSVDVELPSKMSGKIKITSISSSLTKILELQTSNADVNDSKDCAQLDKMFHVGQFIPTVVTVKDHIKKSVKLSLSMKPSDIHNNWSCEKFRKGCIIWAAVEAKQEHGYQLSVGNESCRVFLPSKNITSGVTYEIGQPLWCRIRKSTIASDMATIVVTALDNHVKVSEDMESSCLIPGSLVNFTVTKVLSHGLLGTFLKGNKGFILETFFKTPLQSSSDYSIGDNFKAVVLYVDPVTKHTCLSLRGTSNSSPEYKNDTIVKSKIIRKVKNGIYTHLPNTLGFVSSKRITSIETYPINSEHNCRILDYRYLEQMYICTFDTFVIQKSENVVEDLKIGQTVNVQVTEINSKGVVVKVGKLRGFIQNIHLADEFYSESVKDTINVGDTFSAKVWNVKDTGVYFTRKELLLNTETNSNGFKVNEQYPGIIVKKCLKGLLVIFCGDARGIMLKEYLNKVFGAQSFDLFYEGEVIIPIVAKIGNDDMILKFNIPEVIQIKHKLRVGGYVSAVVTKIDSNELHVKINETNSVGRVPMAHLSSSLSLTPLLLKTYKIGDPLEDLMCVSTDGIPILSLREAREFRINNLKVPKLKDLSIKSVLRCSYIRSQSMRVRVCALLSPKPIVLNLYGNDVDNGLTQKFVNQQAINAKITRLNRERNLIKITALSSEVFDRSYEESLNKLEQYLNDVLYILKYTSGMAEYSLGECVNCTIRTIRKDQANVVLENNVNGIVFKEHFLESMKIGDRVRGVVLWVNLQKDFLIISLRADVVNRFSLKQEFGIEVSTCVKANILHAENDLAIAIGENNEVIFLPVLCSKKFLRIRPYTHMQRCNIIIKRLVNGMILGIDKSLLEKKDKPKKTTPVKSPKIITECSNQQSDEPEETDVTETENSFKHNPRILTDVKDIAPTLPGVENFFNNMKIDKSDSSSDDDLPTEKKTKQKKKLTAAERTELIRQTEEKIRAKEIELADSTLEPQNEQHFERLIMGNPNSSELWAKYIAYCVSNAEIHKARSIAKSALKRIDMKETEERYNIWITLLNLENNYGDKDSFNSAFEEAVRCNDDLQIYLDVINLLANSEKFAEMNEKIKKVKSKHRGNPKMWINIAHAYYKCGHIQDARNVHSSALKSIEIKSNHIGLIVQFAIMEFNYGERHHAEALFETVLQSNPKRVDVWSSYVDQMVKKDNIDGARRILERAVSQNIPPKKIKILFKKFKELELKVGNEQGVKHVINLAKQYLGEKDE